MKTTLIALLASATIASAFTLNPAETNLQIMDQPIPKLETVDKTYVRLTNVGNGMYGSWLAERFVLHFNLPANRMFESITRETPGETIHKNAFRSLAPYWQPLFLTLHSSFYSYLMPLGKVQSIQPKLYGL